MKQKQHRDDGRVKLREFKLSDVFLVRNCRYGVVDMDSRKDHLVERSMLLLWEPRTIRSYIDHLKSKGYHLPSSLVAHESRLEKLPCEGA